MHCRTSPGARESTSYLSASNIGVVDQELGRGERLAHPDATRQPPLNPGRFNVPADLDIHVIVDNNSTHKTPAIQRWLVRHPRRTSFFTPTYSSWLNLVERWFAELTEKWLRRGTHRSTRELVASIRTWIHSWNDNPRPFIWHKTADEILTNLANYCDRISDSGH